MLTVQSVTNPVYGNAEGTHINCTVKFAEFPNPLPFGANEWDPMDHGQSIYNDLKAGKYGPIGAYVAPVVANTQPQATVTGTTTV